MFWQSTITGLESVDWTGLDSDDVIDNVLLHLRAGFDYLEYLTTHTWVDL